MNTISQTHLKEALDYNPITGIFTWNVRPLEHFSTQRACSTINSRCAGKVAGNVSKSHGYLVIRINGKLKHLGRFLDIADAIDARKRANIKYSYHKNHGLVA